VGQDVFFDGDFVGRDGLQRELLGQGLHELVLADEAHVDGHFAQQLPGMLMLFVHKQLLLLVGDEPHVDQDLSDTAMCHEISC
jgi:hypothetical protein